MVTMLPGWLAAGWRKSDITMMGVGLVSARLFVGAAWLDRWARNGLPWVRAALIARAWAAAGWGLAWSERGRDTAGN
jgi:hypothetical protein